MADSKYWRADGKFYQQEKAIIDSDPPTTRKWKEWRWCDSAQLELLHSVPGVGRHADLALSNKESVLLEDFVTHNYNKRDIPIACTSGLLCEFLKLRAPGYTREDTEQAFYRWLWIDKQIAGNLHTRV